MQTESSSPISILYVRELIPLSPLIERLDELRPSTPSADIPVLGQAKIGVDKETEGDGEVEIVTEIAEEPSWVAKDRESSAEAAESEQSRP